MMLNETDLFGIIAAIPNDLHSAKTLCLGEISVDIRTASSINLFSPSVESLFLPYFLCFN